MAAALEQAREVELEGHCWCLSGAAPRRFASVGVMRPSEPPAARVSRSLRGPARAMGPQEAAPSAPAWSRWGLLASDDASVPTAASDRFGAAREGVGRLDRTFCAYRARNEWWMSMWLMGRFERRSSLIAK